MPPNTQGINRTNSKQLTESEVSVLVEGDGVGAEDLGGGVLLRLARLPRAHSAAVALRVRERQRGLVDTCAASAIDRAVLSNSQLQVGAIFCGAATMQVFVIIPLFTPDFTQ